MPEAAPQASQDSIRICRQLQFKDRAVAVHRRDAVLAAARRPFDRTSKLHRRPRDQDLFGVGSTLGPETSSDVLRKDPHLVVVQAQVASQAVPHQEHGLR